MKPREFWILTQNKILLPLVVDSEEVCQAIINRVKRSNEPDSIHVIEKSAYDAERALRLELQKAVETCWLDRCGTRESIDKCDEIIEKCRKHDEGGK